VRLLFLHRQYQIIKSSASSNWILDPANPAGDVYVLNQKIPHPYIVPLFKSSDLHRDFENTAHTSDHRWPAMLFHQPRHIGAGEPFIDI
jgi:hypothetical protein